MGNWEKSEYGRNLKTTYSKNENIYLLAPIYEPHTINFLRSNASLYVHGHSAGGTNPSLVEAMCLGLPIVAFDCVYNRETTEGKAMYWKTSDELSQILVSKNDFNSIGKAMKEIADRRYRWAIVAEQYNSLYI